MIFPKPPAIYHEGDIHNGHLLIYVCPYCQLIEGIGLCCPYRSQPESDSLSLLANDFIYPTPVYSCPSSVRVENKSIVCYKYMNMDDLINKYREEQKMNSPTQSELQTFYAKYQPIVEAERFVELPVPFDTAVVTVSYSQHDGYSFGAKLFALSDLPGWGTSVFDCMMTAKRYVNNRKTKL